MALTAIQCISNLKTELIHTMAKKRCSIVSMSVQCDMSYKALYNIINARTADMRLSTFLRICENINASLVSVFGVSDSSLLDDALSKAVFTIGSHKYILKRIL